MTDYHTTIPISLPGAGGRYDNVLLPPASARPPSPKLGDFSNVFEAFFKDASDVSSLATNLSTLSVASGDPVKAKPYSEATVAVSETSNTTASVSRGPTFSMGFLSGLDISAIETPSGTPGSLVLDTISEDEDSEDDEDGNKFGEAGRSGLRLPGTDELFTHPNGVVIASPSSSPPASMEAVTLKAAAAVAAVAAGTSPARLRSQSKSPKRGNRPSNINTSGKPGSHPLPNQYDINYQGLLPGSAFINVPPLAYIKTNDNTIQPKIWQTKQQKLDSLRKKLKPEFKRDRSLRFPGAAPDLPNTTSLHVFVDLSNIVIGFYNRLKVNRQMDVNKKLRETPFFFEGFQLILERNRPTERRITTGSASDNGSWSSYMRQAEELGYEMNILYRVVKTVPSASPPPKKQTLYRPFGAQQNAYNNNGYNNSYSNGYSNGHKKSASWGNNGNGLSYPPGLKPPSPPAPPTPTVTKIGEQGVDEILHLKMCHSILDHKPGTIVLATGDAAAAEFSDGFLAHVKRALAHDWHVELYSWKMGFANAWRELEKKDGGAGKFRIIELDRFAEDLLDMHLE